MRFGVFALAGALLLPAALPAQGGFAAEPPEDLVPFTRFAVTPWVGLRVPYGSGDFVLFTEGDQFTIEEDRGGAPAIGLNAEVQVLGPLNVVGGVAWSGGDEDELQFITPAGTESLVVDGPEIWFAKLGLQYRLPDPVPDNRRFHPAAYVTVAPAVLRMDWPTLDGVDDDDITGSATHFALNLGVDAAARIGSRGLTLTFGFEDFITFWDQDRVRARDEALYGLILEEPVVINYNDRASNILMLRAGLSWRF